MDAKRAARFLSAPGAGLERARKVARQRILSSIVSWPPSSKPKGIVGCADRGCKLHPSSAKPVAVKLAVKIPPERTTDHTHTIFVDIRLRHIERFDPR